MTNRFKNRTKGVLGFTVIELLIATAVFSVVLLVFLTAFLRISQLFYKGVNLSNTQEAARNIVQTVASDIQFYKGGVSQNPDLNYFCVGDHRYTYSKFRQFVPDSNYVLLEENLSGCPPPGSPTPDITRGHELASPGMQLNKLQLLCLANECTITARVIFYGNSPTGLFLSPSNPSSSTPWAESDSQCTGPAQSTQYCATAEYSSTVILQGRG